MRNLVLSLLSVLVLASCGGSKALMEGYYTGKTSNFPVVVLKKLGTKMNAYIVYESSSDVRILKGEVNEQGKLSVSFSATPSAEYEFAIRSLSNDAIDMSITMKTPLIPEGSTINRSMELVEEGKRNRRLSLAILAKHSRRKGLTWLHCHEAPMAKK